MISVIVTSIGYSKHIEPLYHTLSGWGDFEFVFIAGDHLVRKSRAELTNIGLAAATGDWLLVLDDDVVCKGAYWETIHSLDSNCVYGCEIHPNKLEHDVRWLNEWCILIPRELYEKIGGFDENFKTSMAFGGADYCLRAQEAGYGVEPLDVDFRHLEAGTKMDITPGHEATRVANLQYLKEKWNL